MLEVESRLVVVHLRCLVKLLVLQADVVGWGHVLKSLVVC